MNELNVVHTLLTLMPDVIQFYQTVSVFGIQAPSILFAPSHLLALFTLGIGTALVLDAGYSETVVLPISFWKY